MLRLAVKIYGLAIRYSSIWLITLFLQKKLVPGVNVRNDLYLRTSKRSLVGFVSLRINKEVIVLLRRLIGLFCVFTHFGSLGVWLDLFGASLFLRGCHEISKFRTIHPFQRLGSPCKTFGMV